MGVLLAGIVVAVVSASGALVTAYLARKSSKDVNFRNDFVALVDALKSRVEQLEATVVSREHQIDRLQVEVDECEAKRLADRRALHALAAKVEELGG